ncbi:MFS transporter [Porphyrobacter algicida]|uniref:MFS transporter n=1 Tax=Qipengyuania algicida TaxID=1836209 RepID=A0A845AKU2_9SPHN|nr:MFS transporter [Qipengyuania algicida]
MEQAYTGRANGAVAHGEKPRLGFWALFNMSFGFFGIQIGFALQNSNMSRVFQTLGASLDTLPVLWIAAPLTGLIVQPIIGHLSDRTWGRLGRRRPYFLTGAILAATALFLIPEAPGFGAPLLFAAAMLWLLDASLNISMEPFRAFVGDMLRTDQHAAGYAVQTAFIGAGAVVGSIFPWLLDQYGVANVASGGGIPDTVRYSFWAGGAALLVAVLWTVLTTREYSPEQQAAFAQSAVATPQAEHQAAPLASKSYLSSILWIAAGIIVVLLVEPFQLKIEIEFLGAMLIVYGALSAIAIFMARQGRGANMLSSIVGDFSGMPPVMKRLALVQFFSWSSLFIMWIYSGPIVSQYFFGSTDTASQAYNDGANWWSLIYTIENAVAAVAALAVLPWLSRKIGQVGTHMVALLCGAAGFLGYFALRDPNLLIVCEILKGIAWASILAMPYAILASNLPQAKLGVYMGLFNIFIVVPQLLVATVMGSIMEAFFPTQPIWTMLFAAGSWIIAALAMLRVRAAL